MRVAQLTWLLSVGGGGIPPVVFGVSEAARGLGKTLSILGVNDPGAAPLSALAAADVEGRLVGPKALGWSPQLATELLNGEFDVVHLHGLFTMSSHAAARWQTRRRMPLVISPHGMLEPWALARSVWKKRLFSLAFERRALHQASCFHALCAEEAENIRRLGIRAPIAVIPNGVRLDEGRGPGDREESRAMLALSKPERALLFLSRVHPKKGLPMLLQAWHETAAQRDGWVLVVAGPDQGNHTGELQALASSLNLGQSVRFVGPLYGEHKAAALAAADAFVLPSHSEGFSVAVLEAMAARLPVVITTACHLDVDTIGCGWLASPTTESIAQGLRRLFEADARKLEEMGSKGRAEVESQYVWPRIASQYWELYEWLRGSRTQPSFVST